MKLLPFNLQKYQDSELQPIELLLLHTTAEQLINKITPLIKSKTPFNLSIGKTLDTYVARHLSKENLQIIHNAYKNNILTHKPIKNIGDSNYSITII